MRWMQLHVATLLFGGAAFAAAAEDPLASLRPLAGVERKVLVEFDDTLLDIAYEHRLGFEALARLNPGLDPWIPEPGSVVQLPTRYVLPDADAVGLVINVPEMRLYDFGVEPGPEVFAVAVGDAADPTLLGDFRVGEKRVYPAWNVPRSILEERPELPPVVAPGPENPLGSRWMTIGSSSYGIHGTNVRWSIGRTATHGCVRLYEDEVQRLYERTRPGTRIQIVYQPFKWGRVGGLVYLEAHPDLYGRESDPVAAALALPQRLGMLDAIDAELAARVVREARGIPVRVGRLPDLPSEPVTSKRPS